MGCVGKEVEGGEGKEMPALPRVCAGLPGPGRWTEGEAAVFGDYKGNQAYVSHFFSFPSPLS